MKLSQFPETLAVVRLPAGAEIPIWAEASSIFSITATVTETSLVCAGRSVPTKTRHQKPFIAFEVEATGSAEPKLTIDFSVKNKKTGKVTKLKADVEDIRGATLKQLLLAHRLHAHERAPIEVPVPPEK